MKKSSGPDDITTEILVVVGYIGITELTKWANLMYVQGSFPSELNYLLTYPLHPNVGHKVTTFVYILVRQITLSNLFVFCIVV